MTTANVVTATASVSEVIRNGVDGRARRALVFAPSDPVAVVVLFHPFGFDPEAALFGERVGERLMSDLHGFIGPASTLGLAVVAPAGDGRVLDGVSLAWPPHLDTAIDLAAELSDGRPVYTAGLSQGGLDALVAAGRRPDVVSGAYAVNPIVDVAAWHEDMVNLPVRAFGPGMSRSR